MQLRFLGHDAKPDETFPENDPSGAYLPYDHWDGDEEQARRKVDSGWYAPADEGAEPMTSTAAPGPGEFERENERGYEAMPGAIPHEQPTAEPGPHELPEEAPGESPTAPEPSPAAGTSATEP